MRRKVLVILTDEFTVDLGSGLRLGTLTVLCLGPATDIFQLKINYADVQLCFVRV
jgi:hypothetical protein